MAIRARVPRTATGTGTTTSSPGGAFGGRARLDASRARLVSVVRGRAPRVAVDGGARVLSGPVAAALATSAFLIAFGALHYGFYTRNVLVDTPIYERYGDAIVHHAKVPYRDFSVEYPPAALAAFAVPSLFAPARDFGSYREAFEAFMLLCGATAAALVGLVVARQGAPPARVATRALLAGLAPLLLGPVVLSRFDLWPALLTLAAVVALSGSRNRLGFGLLGIAIAAKLYPAVLLPLAIVHVWRRRGSREAGICTAVLAATLLILIVPLLVVAPHGLWSSLAGQAERPLQLESLGSSALLVAHQAFGVDLTVVFSHGSNNLGGHGADLLATGQTLLGAVVLVALWVAYGRGPQTPERLLRYSAACVCAFVAFGKVLSPQYLIWLIALVLIVPGRRGDVSAVILAGAMLVTQLWFPSHYISLAYHLDPRASWLVFGRDVILVGLLVTLAWPDGRAGRLRTGTVSLVAAVVGLALVGAAASTSVQSGNIRTALLNETGVASTCDAVKPVPSVTSGSAVYETVTQPNNARRSRCLWVEVRSVDGGQLFAAAYAPKFASADPQTNYLGDTGICTNIRGVTGPAGGMSVRVPARTPLVVDVEACSSDELDLLYTLDLRTTARPVAGFVAASAVRTGDGLRFRWRVVREPAGVRFAILRRSGGTTTLVARVPGGSSSLHSYLWRGASVDSAARYFLTAQMPGGDWESRGPLSPDAQR